MRTYAEKAAAFRALHDRPGAFVIPNPWDAGTARLLAALGFEALATTSLGLANALGREDGIGAVSREEVLANCRANPERNPQSSGGRTGAGSSTGCSIWTASSERLG